MPRVLFVHHRPQPSGAAQSLALLISGLSSDWEPHVLVPDGSAARLFESSGASVHRARVPAFTHTWDVQYHGLRWLVAAREAAWLPPHARALRQVIRMIRPAIVHPNDSVMLASGALAARSEIPVVWHLRSSLANDGRDSRSRAILRWLDRYGNAAIAIDTDVAGTFPLRLPVHVIPNPVRVTPGDPAHLDIPAGRLRVGYFGYLRRQKGWPEFLQALRLLADDGIDVHGVVVGGAIRPTSAFRGLHGRLLKALGVPDEEGDFTRMVQALALEDRVTQLPFTNDVGPVMRALDVVAFPNQGRGLGRPVLEAAAYGVPVIASGSRTGDGVPDGDSILLLARASADSLAESLRRLAGDPALRHRLSRGAGKSVAPPAEAAAEVVQVYEQVLHPRRYGVRRDG